MANDLHIFSGGFVRSAMLLLMINAAVLGTTAISLSSAWAYGEVKGWPHSLEMPIRKAPGFYLTYVLCVGLAAAIVLIPGAPLQLIILGVQVLAGIMLPSAIIFLQLLLNDKELLGEYANKPWNNVVNWTIIIVLFALLIGGIWFFSQWVLFVVALTYMFSGIFWRLQWMFRRKSDPPPPAYKEASQIS